MLYRKYPCDLFQLLVLRPTSVTNLFTVSNNTSLSQDKVSENAKCHSDIENGSIEYSFREL